jgi:hypothetical protein
MVGIGHAEPLLGRWMKQERFGVIAIRDMTAQATRPEHRGRFN